MVTKSPTKLVPNYVCELCDYSTIKMSDFNKHLLTTKHKNRTMLTSTDVNNKLCDKKVSCKCGVTFNNRTSLWRHRKICNFKYEEENVQSDKDLIAMLVKQNEELINQHKEFIDILKTNNGNQNCNNINNIMNNNKTFNLNLFLNETCKNAINISDFVNNIKVELDDLEHTGRNGYVEGITNIVVKNLNNLEDHMRPLHCSDFKREVLYIKDNNEWTKETNDKPILTKAIKIIANENIKQISKWKDNYPDCTKSDSNKNDLYLKIVSNSMNGLTKEESDKNIHKIISNVAKKVVIDK